MEENCFHVEHSERVCKDHFTVPQAVHSFLEQIGYRMFRIDWDGLVPCGWDTTLPDQFNALFTAREVLPGNVPLHEKSKSARMSAK